MGHGGARASEVDSDYQGEELGSDEEGRLGEEQEGWGWDSGGATRRGFGGQKLGCRVWLAFHFSVPFFHFPFPSCPFLSILFRFY